VRNQQAGWSGFDSWHGQEIFSFLQQSSLAPGPIQPTVYRVLGTLSMGTSQSVPEANHSTKPSAGVNDEWNYASTPHHPHTPLWLAHVQPYQLFHLITYHLQDSSCRKWMVICVMHWRAGRELSWPL